MKKLIASLLLLATSVLPALQATGAPKPSIPFHASVELSYLTQDLDPDTGLLVTTGTSYSTGTFGVAFGTFEIELDLATLAFTGTRDAVAPDGSTYLVEFTGQFLDAIHSVSEFQISAGTGRFEGLQVSGTTDGTEWADGMGNSSVSTGTATF